jgi:hypothetical protein
MGELEEYHEFGRFHNRVLLKRGTENGTIKKKQNEKGTKKE